MVQLAETRGALLPVYVVTDESAAMGRYRAQTVAGLAALCDSLRAEPRTSAKLRLTVLGFAEDAQVRLASCDPRSISRAPDPVIRGAPYYSAPFTDLLHRIPRDVAALKANGYKVQRPAVFMLTGSWPADPPAWRIPHRQLTDRNTTPAAPNIIAFGIGDVQAQTVRDIATHPRFALVTSDAGTAIADFFRAVCSTLHGSAQALGSANAALAVNEPGHYRTVAAGLPTAAPGTWPAPSGPPAGPGTAPAQGMPGTAGVYGPVLGSPPGAAGPPARPRTRRPRALLLGAIGVALALVAGVAVWSAWPSASSKQIPFYQALKNVASAPGLRYEAALLNGSAQENIAVTDRGEAIGTVTVAGQRVDVLTVGGKTYLKLPNVSLPTTMNLPPSALAGKWFTGNFGMLGPAVSQTMTPSALAITLVAAVEKATDIGPAGTINGVAALRATTPAGDLYITRSSPHQVLRYVPADVGGGSTTPALPLIPALLGLPPLPSAPDMVQQVRLETPPTDRSGQMDLSALSPAELNRTYGDVANETPQLVDAVNTDIQFDLQGKARVSCSAGGCSVSVTVNGRYTTGSDTHVTGGEVSAELTATVSINGLSAGECTDETTFPVLGRGTLSCEPPGAGAVWEEANATAKAEAAAGATPGSTYRWRVLSTAQAHVVAKAMIQAQVDQLVQQVQKDRQATSCFNTANAHLGQCDITPKVTDGNLAHSFDRHAAEWFGGRPTRTANMAEWRALLERAARSDKIVPWSSGSTPTYAYLTRVDGKWFAAQFDRSSGELVTAFRPTNRQLSAMRRLLE